jgi:hypothetical protein
MPDTFVPLTVATTSSAGTGSFKIKVLPQEEAKLAFTPLPAAGTGNSSSKPCAQPALTFQRNGDVITGIRVECGCGQVIELTCVY